jgi:ParB family chromosome partitioning protein
MSVLETTPTGTQAKILRKIAGEKYPKMVIGPMAAQYGMTLPDIQTILQRNGYPDPAKMLAAAERLEQAHAPTNPEAAEPDDGPELGTLSHVPVEQLLTDPDNPRDHLTDIEELADSMRESGLLQPVVVRRHEGRLYVVAGHRRLAAAKHLRWTEIPCIVRRDMRPDAVLAAMLIENGQRKDLDPIEEARGLHRLKHQLHCSDLELAKRIGRSQPHVSSRLALLSLTAEEQEQVRTGEMKIIEATHRGRLNSGKVRPNSVGVGRNWHLGLDHSLAEHAKARCKRSGHPRGRTVGGMACGACWESVIRADERDHLMRVLADTGRCTVCGAVDSKADA